MLPIILPAISSLTYESFLPPSGPVLIVGHLASLGSYTSYHVTATPYFANARDFTSDDVTWLHYKNVDEEVFNLPVTNSAPVVVSRLDLESVPAFASVLSGLTD